MCDLSLLALLPYVGNCADKDNVLQQLKERDTTRCYQIFLQSRMGSSNFKISQELYEVRDYVKEHDRKVYIHAPHNINLSGIFPEGDEWNLKLLIQNLTSAHNLGFRGVVIHVGKAVKLTTEVARKKMIDNIIVVLRIYESLVKDPERCPLLLETPAGQGTELSTKVEDFVSIIPEVRAKIDNPIVFKVCIDTCHVFASGYDPMEYIRHFDPDDIGLIHYNGSLCPKGSKKDRHSFTESCIGVEEMMNVYEFGMKHGISLVIE